MTSPDGIALEADEYADGRLDWHTFTATGTTGQPAGRPHARSDPFTVVPTAVTYPGMPASRLWEFEDARVNFGAVEAQPEDLGRMLLSGFALVYGANWLLVPLEVPVGALVRITRLDVRDTFGRTTTVGPTAPGGEWGMFGVSRADGARRAARCSIAPALAASLQGRDVEEVLLLRDEAANLAWAVERAVEGEDGRPADRAQAAHEARPAGPARRAAAPDALPYRLRTDPPPHWFPLLPQRALPTDPSMTFRLGALPRVTPGGPATPLRRAAACSRRWSRTPRSRCARTRSRARARASRAPTSSRAGSTAAPTSGSAGARRSAAARARAACASTPPTRRPEPKGPRRYERSGSFARLGVRRGTLARSPRRFRGVASSTMPPPLTRTGSGVKIVPLLYVCVTSRPCRSSISWALCGPAPALRYRLHAWTRQLRVAMSSIGYAWSLKRFSPAAMRT